MSQKPSIGRSVHYRLTAAQAAEINRRRTTSASIAERIKHQVWPLGAQAHIGNSHTEGQVLPLTIVVVHDEPLVTVNGQALLDGNDTLWVTSASEGDQPGQWSWPPRT